MGWRTPVGVRPVADRNFSFPVTIPAGAARLLYLRVYKLRGTQVIPLMLWYELGYMTNMPREYLFWGGILLSLLFVAVMSLFFFITTRDSIYWSYMLCVLCLMGFSLSTMGSCASLPSKFSSGYPGRIFIFCFLSCCSIRSLSLSAPFYR